MTARLGLFLSGVLYGLLCQFWEYEVSDDDDDDVCSKVLFLLEGRSIGCIYGWVVYVTCILWPMFGELMITLAPYFNIFYLQVTQK